MVGRVSCNTFGIFIAAAAIGAFGIVIAAAAFGVVRLEPNTGIQQAALEVHNLELTGASASTTSSKLHWGSVHKLTGASANTTSSIAIHSMALPWRPVIATTAAAANQSVTEVRFQKMLGSLQNSGAPGHCAIVVFFSTWIFFALPTTTIEIALGFIYGALLGFVCDLCCKFSGSCAAFLFARQLGKRCGWKVPEVIRTQLAMLQSRPVCSVIGIRLMPVPLGVSNYGLGLSEVGLLQFSMATAMTDIPFSALWATVGSSCRSLSEALTTLRNDSGPAVTARAIIGCSLPSLVVISLICLMAKKYWRGCGFMECCNKKELHDIESMALQAA